MILKQYCRDNNSDASPLASFDISFNLLFFSIAFSETFLLKYKLRRLLYFCVLEVAIVSIALMNPTTDAQICSRSAPICRWLIQMNMKYTNVNNLFLLPALIQKYYKIYWWKITDID